MFGVDFIYFNEIYNGFKVTKTRNEYKEEDNSNPEGLDPQGKNLPENPIPKITIICSAPDLASQNIKTHLLKMKEWEPSNFPKTPDSSSLEVVGWKIQACEY